MVRMRRCLLVECIGEDRSSNGALDCKNKAKRHKEDNNQSSTFRPFKTEKNGKDEKMLTRGARRRRWIVNRSPRLQDMSKRAGWGEVGPRGEKRRKKAKMKRKGRAARYKVGPRMGPSRTARHGLTRVSPSAPKPCLESRTTLSHPVRSFSTLRMSVWRLKGLTRKLR